MCTTHWPPLRPGYPEKSELFLVKLALLNANALANPQTFKDNIAAALRDV